MSCGGCQPAPAVESIVPTMRCRAVVCVACAGPSAHTCPESGEPVLFHVNGKPCPRGKHPDANGIVRFASRLWLGAPSPLRTWAWCNLHNETDRAEFVAKFPGCGCLLGPKMFLLRLAAAPWFARWAPWLLAALMLLGFASLAKAQPGVSVTCRGLVIQPPPLAWAEIQIHTAGLVVVEDDCGWLGSWSCDIPIPVRIGGGSRVSISSACNVAYLLEAPTGTEFALIDFAGVADYDGDGDVGTDRDVQAFFACMGDPGCPRRDYDGDGDPATDADVEAFFRIIAGGPC